MKKTILAILLIALIPACQSISEVCFDNTCFEVEVADDSAERSEGLMYREYMHPEHGMLFIFDEPGRYPFWMKNTKIPLDMIWMDSNKSVVYVQHNAKPCRKDPCRNYDPKTNALYVLEVNSGIAESENITVGEKATFN